MSDDRTEEFSLEGLDLHLEEEKQASDKVLDTISLLAKERYMFVAVPVESDTKIYQMLNAENAFLALWSIVENAEWRNLLKHGGADKEFGTPEQALQWAKDTVIDILDEYGIDLDRGCE